MRRALIFLAFLPVPPLLFFGATRLVTPPPFDWSSDPVELLVARTPVAHFMGARRVSALGDRVEALFSDDSTITIVLADTPAEARERAAETLAALAAEGAEITGAAPAWSFVRAHENPVGRLYLAREATIRIDAPSASVADFRLYSVPSLVDRRGQSLYRTLFEQHRTVTVAALLAYLGAGALLAARLFQADRAAAAREAMPAG